uniref:Uncharacterized protein n=1 Tax=Eutreptiella gymnastica TaxID=73025 RepID=A0A7S4LL28_9EUGL
MYESLFWRNLLCCLCAGVRWLCLCALRFPRSLGIRRVLHKVPRIVGWFQSKLKPKPKSKPAPQPKMTRAQQLVSEVNTKAFQEAMADIEAGRTPGQGRPKPAPKSSTQPKGKILTGTTVKGTGPQGRTVGSGGEPSAPKPGARFGAKGKAAAAEAAEARMQALMDANAQRDA